jgi:D-alanine-D-alanine ligase
MRRLDVTVMMDEGYVPADDPDFTSGSLEPSTERHVVVTLRELGHRARVLPVGHELEPILQALGSHRPDIVFNLAEQFANDRRMDKNLVGLLDMMGIRYTGAGPTGMMLCRDKGLCKQILSLHKIRVPDFLVLRPGRPVRPGRRHFPLIVKPLLEDGSDGISMASVVSSGDELAQRARLVHERFGQVAIAEEYVEGRELYVGVLGNHRLKALPAREIRFGSDQGGGPGIATSRVKYDKEYREKWGIEYDFAELPAGLGERVARVCKRAYRLLQLRDFGRVDLRLTPDEKIVVLEVNPNPDIAYGEDFAEGAARAGIQYEALIERILRLAMSRYEGR